jgi:DNA-binding transcriptional LysR family regulator
MPYDARLLSGVTVLMAVVEAGSMARAAEALGLTSSGVGWAIGRLETRVGDPPGGSLIARKLVETRILTVASPEFVARYGRPKHPSEVESYDA